MTSLLTITTISIFSFILVIPVITHAQLNVPRAPLTPPLGSPQNPIYFKDASEATKKNDATIDRLKSRYGISAFYDCYNGYAHCLDKDIANPNTHASCLVQTQYCLEHQDLDAQYRRQWEQDCKKSYGSHSILGFVDYANKKYDCGCEAGYMLRNGACLVNQPLSCPADQILSGNQCITRDQGCVDSYGANAYWNGKFTDDGGKYLCDCRPGYLWNPSGTACVAQTSETPDPVTKGIQDTMDKLQSTIDDAQIRVNVLERERARAKAVDRNLSARLNGLILLQVEQGGEGWYVYPDDQRRYYLGRPSDAYNLMRRLGLGATHAFITGYTTYPAHVLGKILIDVEDHGKAYYIYPKDRKAYYLGRPEDAFRVMRELGLGISNADIGKIAVEN